MMDDLKPLQALEAAHAAFRDPLNHGHSLEAAIFAYNAKMDGPVVARAHITMENGAPYPDIDLEVLDGASLQPEMSPVLLYASPVPVMVTDAMVEAVARGICKLHCFDPDRPTSRSGLRLKWMDYTEQAREALAASNSGKG